MTRLVQQVSFQCLILTFRPPVPFSMLSPGESVHGAYCNIEKGERGGLLSSKKMLFEITEKRR